MRSENFTAGQSVRRLVSVVPGDLPIILTAPHGGGNAIDGVPKRQGNGVGMFKAMSDAFTDQLTEKLADAIEKQTGKRPYTVIARFHRKYLDANRRAQDAYESPNAAPIHDYYHQAIVEAKKSVTDRWGRGLLIDIHGQAKEPKAIFRGTQNGKTTKHLVKRFGVEALQGKASLFGQLAAAGFPVIPDVGSTDLEHSAYDGGYTVVTHGSLSGGTIDAIQLELGRHLRVPGANIKTADQLAKAIIAFSEKYLPAFDQLKRNR
ncbi:MAG: hypothetical protein ABJZ55_00930 [Fuerstiella sp.]